MRILLVDDDEVDRAIFTKMIQSAGHEVIAAESGQAAIAANAVMAFDLILMDQRMPEMDGIETTRRIRAMEGARGRVPVVALSGSELPADLYRDARMDAFVNKDRLSVGTITKALADAMAAWRERNPPAEAVVVAAKPVNDGILIPRVIAIGLVLGMPSMIGAAAWYMSSQANDARHLAEAQVNDARHLADALVQARSEITAQQTGQAALIRQAGEALAKLDHDQTEMVNRLDNRLTRLEAQMNFFVGSGVPALPAKR